MKVKLFFTLLICAVIAGCSKNEDGGSGGGPTPQDIAGDYSGDKLKTTFNNASVYGGQVEIKAAGENKVSVTLYDIISGIVSIEIPDADFEQVQGKTMIYASFAGSVESKQLNKKVIISGTVQAGILRLTVKTETIVVDIDPGDRVTFAKDKKHVIKVFSIIIDPVITRAINGNESAIGKRWHEYFTHPKYGTRWNDPRDLALEYEQRMEEASGGTIDFEVTQIEADTAWFCANLSTPAFSFKEIEDFMADRSFWDTYESLYKLGSHWQYKNMVEYYNLDTKRDADQVHEVWVFGPPIMCMYETCHVSKNGLWCNGSATTNVSNSKIMTVVGYNYERDLDCMVHNNIHRAENMLKYAYNGEWRTGYEVTVPGIALNNWELYSIYEQTLPKGSKHKASCGNCHYPPTATYNYDYYTDRTIESYAYAWADYPWLDLDKREPQQLNSRTEWDCRQDEFCLWWFAHLPNKEGVNPLDGRLNNWWLYIFDYDIAAAADNATNVSANGKL